MVSSISLILPTFLAATTTSWSASPVLAFQIPSASTTTTGSSSVSSRSKHFPLRLQQQQQDDDNNNNNNNMEVSRRSAIATAFSSLILLPAALPNPANAEEENMYAPKFVQAYDDFQSTPEGWSYKEVKEGKDIGGGDLKDGDRVVFDWSGYTIGYFGRPFEAKGGPQGGAFDKDLNYFRTVLGSKTLIPGLECALRTMKPGGIRQVIIPYGALSYPPEDKEHEAVGPKPTTFSGMRALNFVLENPRVDRTLLFNIKVVRVDRSDGKGGFIRGDKM
mmetsp:Transcript_20147/g.32651  ORF Transcript_20147/g.32651 Transcript_20147/m.32651 type:complete len:276 (-) Transcript_20147:297-1124(-)|eukprot:CAMPEP_0196130448 /NCGR_PEP_ID=MMETSP0910-20130528/812_1 /TAXON_ID=49265 /ORGANISM="Thalassiosira rotula, Strain GSO102" /LENGTH=275 /DNA_ID=CAMNT_0041389751 /DNA_START=104 /DNA_END=931 /DNA_ORIENTATION=+